MNPIKPMLAELALEPFDSPSHIFEAKYDGVRCLAHIQGGKVELQARSGAGITAQYPEVVACLSREVQFDQVVLDGEIVAFNDQGVPDFNRIQQRINKRGRAVDWAMRQFPATYRVFDIPIMEGKDLTAQGMRTPLMVRKELLARVVPPGGLTEYWDTNGKTAFECLVEEGWEGVVAKDKEGLYYPGQRHPAWKKLKAHKEDSFIIGGFTRGKGWREGLLGALIVGKPNGSGKLRWVAEVGSGMKDAVLRDLTAALPRLQVEESPFSDYTGGSDVAMWVRPLLVVDVKYIEVTRDGHLRWPIFLRVRTDMRAEEVRK